MPKIAQKQEDFAEFLERVNAHLPCEACRKGAWTLPAANQGLVLNLPVVWVRGRQTPSAWRPGVVLVDDLAEGVTALLAVNPPKMKAVWE